MGALFHHAWVLESAVLGRRCGIVGAPHFVLSAACSPLWAVFVAPPVTHFFFLRLWASRSAVR